jgi:serine/threonine protein kinase
MVDFIRKCLTMDPLVRMKCDEALNHPWLDEAKNESEFRRDIARRAFTS